ncbi:chorismate mutase [Bradyrhizobium sp. USDA 4501]
MDNKINEIRRKISTLRAEMSLIEASIRDQVNRDLDCSEASYRLIAMRAEVVQLVGRWKAAGGGERLPTVRERLSRSFEDRAGAKIKVDKDKAKPTPGHSNARV